MLHANNNLKIYYCSGCKNKEIFLTTYLNVKQLAQLDLIENILNSEMPCEMHILQSPLNWFYIDLSMLRIFQT